MKIFFKEDSDSILLKRHVGADDDSIIENRLLNSHLTQAGTFLLKVVQTATTDVGDHDVVCGKSPRAHLH